MSTDKSRFTSAIKCAHCSNVAPMQVVTSFADMTNYGDEHESHEEGPIFELLKCSACQEVTLRSYYWSEMMSEEDEVIYKQLYPSDPRIPTGLPELIEKAYRAALRVKPVDANAFVVLVGRALEIVCADRGAKGGSLHDKLKDLATRGEIPSKLVEVADKLRLFRNLGAHAELGDVTAQEVPIVEDLCRALLDYIYTAPQLALRAETHLAKLTNKRERKKAGSKEKIA